VQNGGVGGLVGGPSLRGRFAHFRRFVHLYRKGDRTQARAGGATGLGGTTGNPREGDSPQRVSCTRRWGRLRMAGRAIGHAVSGLSRQLAKQEGRRSAEEGPEQREALQDGVRSQEHNPLNLSR